LARYEDRAPGPPWLSRVECGIGWAVDAAAVLLVVIDIVTLLAGVIARYAFHRPIVWADEFAGAVFIWMAMLGAVIALRRGEHMRFAGLVVRLPIAWRRRAELASLVLVAVALALLVQPAMDYVEDESFATMPNLGIAYSWRVGALLFGLVLMVFTAVLQALRGCRWRDVGVVVGPVLAAAGVMVVLGPALTAIGNANLLVFFVLMIGVCIAAGVPIGFAFGLSTTSYLALTTTVPLSVVLNRLDQGMSQPVLLAIPMFVFLGLLIELTGLAGSMVTFLAALLGTVRGGLNYVLLVAMMLVSGISGSKAADMAAVAPALFPEMKRRGGDEGEMVALLSASAAMADTIPPSLVLITFGSVTGISIAALFAAGLVPAVVLAAALAVVAFLRSRGEARATGRLEWGSVGRTFVAAIPGLLLPFVIRAAVVEGVATATEVSTLGVAYALVAGVVFYRPVQWGRMVPALVETAALSGAILFVIGTASAMAWALTQSGFSGQMVATMASVPGGAAGFLLITLVAFVLLGNILEGIPAILLFGPLLLPVSHGLGIHDVHYAMVVVVAMSIGLFAPPFGIGFYAACAIGRVPPDQAVRHVWKYLFALFLGLLVIAAVPTLSTGLL